MSFIARNIAVKVITSAIHTAATATPTTGKRSIRGGGLGDDLQSRLERHRQAGRVGGHNKAGGGGGGLAIQEGTSLPDMAGLV
jgi:hypothetical protein